MRERPTDILKKCLARIRAMKRKLATRVFSFFVRWFARIGSLQESPDRAFAF